MKGNWEDLVIWLIMRIILINFTQSFRLAAWLYMESGAYTENQVLNRASSMLNTSTDEAEGMAELVWGYYGQPARVKVIIMYLNSANSNAQVIITDRMPSTDIYDGPGTEPGPEPEPDIYETGTVSASSEDSVSVEAFVSVTKHDSVTQETLAGAQIEINGSSYTTGAEGDSIPYGEGFPHSIR